MIDNVLQRIALAMALGSALVGCGGSKKTDPVVPVNNAPVISLYNIAPSTIIYGKGIEGVYTFSGSVHDDDNDTLSLTLRLNGTNYSVPVNPDGTFSYTRDMGYNSGADVFLSNQGQLEALLSVSDGQAQASQTLNSVVSAGETTAQAILDAYFQSKVDDGTLSEYFSDVTAFSRGPFDIYAVSEDLLTQYALDYNTEGEDIETKKSSWEALGVGAVFYEVPIGTKEEISDYLVNNLFNNG